MLRLGSATDARRPAAMSVDAERGREHAYPAGFSEARLDALQHLAFEYFLRGTNLSSGLVADKSEPGAPASSSAVGFV